MALLKWLSKSEKIKGFYRIMTLSLLVLLLSSCSRLNNISMGASSVKSEKTNAPLLEISNEQIKQAKKEGSLDGYWRMKDGDIEGEIVIDTQKRLISETEKLDGIVKNVTGKTTVLKNIQRINQLENEKAINCIPSSEITEFYIELETSESSRNNEINQILLEYVEGITLHSLSRDEIMKHMTIEDRFVSCRIIDGDSLKMVNLYAKEERQEKFYNQEFIIYQENPNVLKGLVISNGETENFYSYERKS